MIKDNVKFLRQVYFISLTVALLITLLLFVIVPSYKVGIFLGLAALLGGGFFLMNRGLIKLSVQVYLWSLFVTLTIYSCSTGGVIAPGFIWFAICPIISGVLINSACARGWLLGVLVMMTALVIWEDILVFDVFKGGNYWYLISYSTLFYTVVKLLLSLRATINKHASELESKNSQLLQRQRKIVKQNEVIGDQYDSIKEQNEIIHSRNVKLEQYFDLVMDIGRMDEIHSGNFHFSLKQLSDTLLNTLKADRVIFWEYGERQDALVAINVNDCANDGCKLYNNTIKGFGENTCG